MLMTGGGGFDTGTMIATGGVAAGSTRGRWWRPAARGISFADYDSGTMVFTGSSKVSDRGEAKMAEAESKSGTEAIYFLRSSKNKKGGSGFVKIGW